MNSPRGGNPWKCFGCRGKDNSSPPLLMPPPTTPRGGGIGADPWRRSHNPHPRSQTLPPPAPPHVRPGAGSYQTHPPAPAMVPMRWGAPVCGGYPSRPLTEKGLGDLGMSGAIIHAFAAALQGVVAVVAVAPPPLPSRTSREGCNPLAPAHLLCMQGGSIKGINSHLGGSSERKRNP